MRFDPLDPYCASPATASAPAPRPPRRGAAAPTPPQSSLNFRSFPAWARLDPQAPDPGRAACFAAGAGLALLDGLLRENPPGASAWRSRLALRAAAAGARILRLREDEGALRDAEHLAASETLGPAGRLHRLWRSLVAQDLRFDAARFGEALQLLEAQRPHDLAALVAELRELARAPGDPITRTAQAAARAYRLSPGPEGEIFALWVADLLLALRLGWDRPAPLLMTKILEPALRRGPVGARPRPSDPDWPQAVAAAYALAAADAHALALEVSRRANKLLAAAPRLRAKGASCVVDLLLADDAASPARAAKLARLSDRAARRLFDRLVELGAVREVSGRSTFRLYGL